MMIEEEGASWVGERNTKGRRKEVKEKEGKRKRK